MTLANNNNNNHGIKMPSATAIVGFGSLRNHITTTIATAYQDNIHNIKIATNHNTKGNKQTITTAS